MPRSNVEEDMAAQLPYIYRPYHRRAMKTRIFNGLGLGIDPDKYVDPGTTVFNPDVPKSPPL